MIAMVIFNAAYGSGNGVPWLLPAEMFTQQYRSVSQTVLESAYFSINIP